MRRSFLLVFLALGVVAAPRVASALATIDLAWDNCAFDNFPTPNHNVTFACNGSRGAANPYRLFATVHAPTGGYPEMAAVQAQIDLQDETGAFPAFWAFEPGGCNESYLRVGTSRPSSCGSTANNPWVPVSDAQGFILSYTRSGNRVHVEVVVVTLPTVSQNLLSNWNYYLFDLQIDEGSIANAPPGCAGCTHKVAAIFQGIRIESSAEGPVLNVDPLVISQPGAFGFCATVNGASAGTCAAVPTRNMTWGAVKSLYR